MKKKKLPYLILLIFILSCLSSVYGQEADLQAKRISELDEQIWKPFVKAWELFDAVSFNELHSDDVLRANKWGLRVGMEYKTRNIESFAKSRAAGIKRTIEFWFEERSVTDDVAYEVGYYRINNQKPGEESREYYAVFHVVSKRINGKWKITQDWDANELNGVKITKSDFEKGTPLNYKN